MPVEYVGMCCMCGMPITKYEIGGEVRGDFIDYIENVIGQASLVYCGDCWRKVREIQDNGIEHAISIRTKLEQQDREDKDKRDRGDPLAP